MAKSFAFKYASLVGCLAFVFVNFVACGAQMYQVSMQNDITPPPSGGGVSVEESSDPDHHYYGLHAPNGWRELPIRFKFGSKMTQDQIASLKAAMGTWEEAVGKQLFEHVGTDDASGDSFKDLYSSLDDKRNGHYLDYRWDKTGKKEEVLATTIWDTSLQDSMAIATADVRFNADHYIIGDSLALTAEGDREVVDGWTLGNHELGHLLGLAHVDPEIDPDSIMVPSLYIGENLYNRYLSEGDVRRIQQIYGCEGDACNIERIMTRLERRSRMALTDIDGDQRRDRDRDDVEVERYDRDEGEEDND